MNVYGDKIHMYYYIQYQQFF